MAFVLSPLGGVGAQLFDDNGDILSGGNIYTYAAGTTTAQATYTDSTGTTAHANPIILESNGRIPGGQMWLNDSLSYKFVVTDLNGVAISTVDNVSVNGFTPINKAGDTGVGNLSMGALTATSVDTDNLTATTVTEGNSSLATKYAAIAGDATKPFSSSAFTEGATLLSDKYEAKATDLMKGPGYTNPKVYGGFVNAVDMGANTTGTLVVNFPAAFSANPFVTLGLITPTPSTDFQAYISAISTTSITIAVVNNNITTASTTVHFIAYGPS